MGGSDDAKLFVGGLSQDTTKDSLRDHFSQHGVLSDAVVMYDAASGRNRGFGFVTFDKADVIDQILSSKQIIDGKEVDCKRACPREVMAQRQFAGGQHQRQMAGYKTNKIFVGGLPDLSSEEFKEYFAKYGKVTDAVLMTDKETNRPRGFGFITYDNTDVVEEVVRKYHDHQIKNKWVEVKKAQSKEQLMRTPEGPAAGRPVYPGYGPYPTGYGDYYDAQGYGRGGYPPPRGYPGMEGGYEGYGAQPFYPPPGPGAGGPGERPGGPGGRGGGAPPYMFAAGRGYRDYYGGAQGNYPAMGGGYGMPPYGQGYMGGGGLWTPEM